MVWGDTCILVCCEQLADGPWCEMPIHMMPIGLMMGCNSYDFVLWCSGGAVFGW